MTADRRNEHGEVDTVPVSVGFTTTDSMPSQMT